MGSGGLRMLVRRGGAIGGVGKGFQSAAVGTQPWYVRHARGASVADPPELLKGSESKSGRCNAGHKGRGCQHHRAVRSVQNVTLCSRAQRRHADLLAYHSR